VREREIAVLLELLPVPVRIFDSAGVLTRRNALASADDATMRGVSLHDYWERDQPRDAESNEPLSFEMWPGARASTGETVRAERMVVVRRHLRHTLEFSAAPVVDDSGQVVGVVVVEQELRVISSDADQHNLNEARARDRRLAAIGQLAAGVMHDVNNALNPIMAAAYLLRHHAQDPDAVRDYADRIRIAAEMGAATASRVGRFIRQEPLHGKSEDIVELGELFDEVLDLTAQLHRGRNVAGREVHVVREFEPGVTTRGIPGELREALLNLVQNASDAMPDGGRLSARTFVRGDEACIAVSDTGVGMRPEVRERAFEPFFTTKGAGGMGLGLAEVYGIAKRHRGSAVLESRPGAGTTVTLCFPFERSGPPPAEAEWAGSPPLRVLVVEDHDDGREFLRRLLTSEGHQVDAVRTCSDARHELAAEHGTRYDLMITDVGLPDGSGWELVAHARDSLPSLRIGVITGWEPTIHSTDDRGAEFVLRKPLRAAELLAHIAGS
jgi:signal transduction histidine kinase